MSLDFLLAAVRHVSTLGQMHHLLTVVLQNRGFVHNSLLFWTYVRSNSLEWFGPKVHQPTWGLYYFIQMKDKLQQQKHVKCIRWTNRGLN